MTKRDSTSLSILCWEGYDDRELLALFEKEFGISVNAKTFISDYAAAEILEKEKGIWDVVNLNSPIARDILTGRDLILPLDQGKFESHLDHVLPSCERLLRTAYSSDGSELLGICQRFGPFNLVVNTDRISANTVKDQGFYLANDKINSGRFGILSFDEFNVMHICIGSNVDPFQTLNRRDQEMFQETAGKWFGNAAVVSCDCQVLNRALVGNEIDFYISGGVYTCGLVRLEGHQNIRAVTPYRGPIAGKGGIGFVEVTSICSRSNEAELAEEFLDYLTRPDSAARVAFGMSACSPIMQMGDPAMIGKFSAEELDAIQWEDLQEDMSRCAECAVMPSYPVLRDKLRSIRSKAGWKLS